MPRVNKGKYVTEASQVFQEADDFWRGGEYEKAEESYQKAADLYEQSDDNEGKAFVLGRLGELETSLENYNKAEQVLKNAADLVRDMSLSQATYVDILLKTAKMEVMRNQAQQALPYLQKARLAAQAINNKDLSGESWDQEAYVLLKEGREDKALEAYKNAAADFRQEKISLKEASTLRAIARILMKKKHYDEAHEVLERCRDLYRENGDLLGEASALSAIGCLRYIIKDIEKARKALMKSVYLYGKVAHHYAEAESLLYLARVEASNKERGDFERAKSHYKRSIELFDFMGNEIMKKSVLEEYNNFLNRIMG